MVKEPLLAHQAITLQWLESPSGPEFTLLDHTTPGTVSLAATYIKI
jgi:hypothetical protein